MSNNDVDMADRTPDHPLQDLGLQEFRDFLTVHWPDSKLAGPGNSGITCLIATIRHLLGFLSQGGRCKVLQFADEAEQKHDVPDNERGVLRAILQGNVRQAVEQIKAIFPEDTTCSFETLIFSEPYRRSMWNNPFFQVYLRRMLGPNAKPDGHPPSQGYHEDPYFTWDGSPGQTLTQHVAKQFGHKTKGMSGWLDKPNFPCFFALKYVSTNKDRRHYHDLSHFFMRIGQPDSPVCSSRYEAAVVVRLRDDQDGLDSLRLYGKWSTPLYELQERLSAPWSNDWLIEQGGEFLIFYVRNDCPVEMPPSTPPEFRPYRSAEQQEFLQFVIKELEKARIEDEQNEQAEQGEQAEQDEQDEQDGQDEQVEQVEQDEQDEQDLDDDNSNGSVTAKDSEQPANQAGLISGSITFGHSATSLFKFGVAPKNDFLRVMPSKETPRQGSFDIDSRTTPPSGQHPPGSSYGSTRHKSPLPPQSSLAPRSTQHKHQRDEQSRPQSAVKRQRLPAPAAPRIDESHSPVTSGTYSRPDGRDLYRPGAPRSPPHRRQQDDYRDGPAYWPPGSNHRSYYDSRPDYGYSRDGYRRDWQGGRSSYDGQGSSRGGHYSTAPTRPDEYRGRSRSRSPPYEQRWRDGRGNSRH